MTPILQSAIISHAPRENFQHADLRLIRLARMILLGLLLLRKMAFAVRNDLSHVRQVVLIVLLVVLLGVLFQDLDDLATAGNVRESS